MPLFGEATVECAHTMTLVAQQPTVTPTLESGTHALIVNVPTAPVNAVNDNNTTMHGLEVDGNNAKMSAYDNKEEFPIDVY